MIEPHAWADELRERFEPPPYSNKVWASIRSTLFEGDTVSGYIAARAPFGVWLDIALPIPALLEVISISDSSFDYQAYQRGDWGPIGMQLTARVVSFRDETFEIRLTQK